MSAESLRERVVEALRAEGLTEDGGHPHGWRCEYPDRYPDYCTCVTETADAVLAVVREWLGGEQPVVTEAVTDAQTYFGHSDDDIATAALSALIDQTKED